MFISSRPDRRHLKSCLFLGSLIFLPLQSACAANEEGPLAAAAVKTLSLEQRTELPGFNGDYDRVGADADLTTLYVAGEDSGKVEVVDLKSNDHLTSLDLPSPHYMATSTGRNEIYVTTTGGDGRTAIIDGKTKKIVGRLEHRPGANPMSYDASRNRLYMIAGGANWNQKDISIVEVDPATRKQVGEVKIDAEKAKGIALEERGNRLFTNVTPLKMVAVINKDTRKVDAMWSVEAPGDNNLIALDEKAGHLFIGMGKPDSLLVLDSTTGATVAKLNMPASSDHLIFDEQNQRLYALGGGGRIAVFARNASGQYLELPSIESAPGAKTGLLVPSANKLFVAVSPGDSGRPGEVLTFRVNK